MTADVPRRLPPGQSDRVRVVATRTSAGSMRGGTRMAKAVQQRFPTSTPFIVPAATGGPVYAYFYGTPASSFSPGSPAGGDFSTLTQPIGVATFGAIVGTDNHAQITLSGWYSMSITAKCAAGTTAGAVKIEAATTADTYCIGSAVSNGTDAVFVHAVSPPFPIWSGDEPVDVSGVLTGVSSSGTLTWMDLRIFRLADA